MQERPFYWLTEAGIEVSKEEFVDERANFRYGGWVPREFTLDFLLFRVGARQPNFSLLHVRKHGASEKADRRILSFVG